MIDGNFITSDPLQKIMAGDVKQDLGFYYHENSRDEVGFRNESSLHSGQFLPPWKILGKFSESPVVTLIFIFGDQPGIYE